jgi:diguanylate cyclase (GGDEF)-like protein
VEATPGPSARAARRPRALVAATAVLAFGYLLSTIVGVRHHSTLADGLLMEAALVAATALAAQGARRAPRERRIWRSLAAAIALWTAGNGAFLIMAARSGTAPVPSVADAGFLGFYPAVYLAIVQLVRARAPRFHATMWLDALVAGVTVAAFTAAMIFHPLVDATGGSLATVATSLAYPVADLLVLALIAGTAVVGGRRPIRSLTLLGAGLIVFAAGDVLFLLLSAQGTYEAGTPIAACWVVGCAVMALAPGAPATTIALPRTGARGVVLPLACTVVALAIIVLDRISAGPLLAFALAIAAIAASVGRGVLTFHEVRELAERRTEARTDELTGLANRRSLAHRLERIVERREHASLLLLDLDHFKELNDTLGHAAGDELLRRIGPRLAAELSPRDLLVRLGGDEFGVVAGREGPDDDRPVELAQRLLRALEDPFELQGIALQVGASVGVAHHPEHATDANGLLKQADVAMYVAKERRSGIELYDAGHDRHTRDQLELAGQLRRAIAEGELVVLHQPKVELATGAILSTEALVRWEHPTEGLLAPAAFLGLAEQTNAMRPLALAVLELALADASEFRAHGAELEVAVNLAAANLLDAELPGIVAAALERHRLPPGALRFEVTETSVLSDPDRCLSVLEGLRRLGVGISIDDFGTGHASLARLAALPADELKIDRSFITDLAADTTHRAIARTIVELGRSLGLRVVAEGIEDDACLEAVRALGADAAQGYGLGRPAPAAEVLRRLAAATPAR